MGSPVEIAGAAASSELSGTRFSEDGVALDALSLGAAKAPRGSMPLLRLLPIAFGTGLQARYAQDWAIGCP